MVRAHGCQVDNAQYPCYFLVSQVGPLDAVGLQGVIIRKPSVKQDGCRRETVGYCSCSVGVVSIFLWGQCCRVFALLPDHRVLYRHALI